ncbi:MAG: hypothetical protein FT671_03150 [Pantoea sp. Brub]|nr:hypothetical protein [Pantoea sp. Brub]
MIFYQIEIMMLSIKNNPLILIDGSDYLYRAYHIFPFLCKSTGEPTGAIYGFINMLNSLLNKYYSNHIAIIFDFQGKNFRNKIFKHYKCHRSPMPNDLIIQIKPLYKIISAMGIPLISIRGVEADDVIGTLAFEAEQKGYCVLISTNDKDIAQLVTSSIYIINSTNKQIITSDVVKQKYGVKPSLIVDMLAIIGDKSDNIPGIFGIGKKTAIILLEALGSLHNIYNNLDTIIYLKKLRNPKYVIEHFKKYRTDAFMSYNLAKIKTDVKLKLNCDNLIVNSLNINKLQKLFNKYEFKSLSIKLKHNSIVKLQ